MSLDKDNHKERFYTLTWIQHVLHFYVFVWKTPRSFSNRKTIQALKMSYYFIIFWYVFKKKLNIKYVQIRH